MVCICCILGDRVKHSRSMIDDVLCAAKLLQGLTQCAAICAMQFGGPLLGLNGLRELEGESGDMLSYHSCPGMAGMMQALLVKVLHQLPETSAQSQNPWQEGLEQKTNGCKCPTTFRIFVALVL